MATINDYIAGTTTLAEAIADSQVLQNQRLGALEDRGANLISFDDALTTLGVSNVQDAIVALYALLGNAPTQISLTGALLGSSSLSGLLLVTQALAGHAASISGASGTLEVRRALTGALSGLSVTSAGITVTRALAGSITSVSSTTASLIAAIELAGGIVSLSGVTGLIAITRAMSASVGAGSVVSGQVTVTRALAGGVFSLAAMTGLLTVATTPASLTLDRLSLAPSTAFSLRKMRAGHSGSDIRVRRSSDNFETDIGFTAGGDLDETALLAHCGSGSGFVTRFYDQMPGGYNATNAIAAQQPRIVLNGVIDKHLGRPKLVQPSGVAVQLRTLPVPRTSHAAAVNVVVPNTGSLIRVFQINDEDYVRFVDGFTYCQMNQTVRTNEAVTNIPTIGSAVLTTINNTTQFVFFRDGTQQTARALSGSYDSAAAAMTVFWNAAPGNEVTMQEAMYFQGVLTTADRQSLERDQGIYYKRVTPGILDALSIAPAAAYSLRSIYGAFNPTSIIRVRRSSDNAEVNIGVTSAGDLDTVALLAHCGAGDGFVTTWYDQSGNARHAVQPTASNQLRIVNAGVVESASGRPMLVAPASGTAHMYTAPIPKSSHASAFNQVIPSATTHMRGAYVGNDDYLRLLDNGLSYVSMHQTARSDEVAWGMPASGKAVATVVNNTTQFLCYRDGALAVTRGVSGSYNSSPSELRIMNSGYTAGYNQTACEIVYFQGVLTTADRQLLERNQGTYYGITVA